MSENDYLESSILLQALASSTRLDRVGACSLNNAAHRKYTESVRQR